MNENQQLKALLKQYLDGVCVCMLCAVYMCVGCAVYMCVGCAVYMCVGCAVYMCVGCAVYMCVGCAVYMCVGCAVYMCVGCAVYMCVGCAVYMCVGCAVYMCVGCAVYMMPYEITNYVYTMTIERNLYTLPPFTRAPRSGLYLGFGVHTGTLTRVTDPAAEQGFDPVSRSDYVITVSQV